MQQSDRFDRGRFWGSYGTSAFGATLTTLGLSFIPAVAWDLSAQTIAVLATAPFVATVACPFWVGHVVDSFPRRHAVVTARWIQSALAVGLSVLVFLEFHSPPALYVFSLLMSAAGSLAIAAESATIPDLFGEQNLVSANGRLQSIRTVSESVATAVGGGIIASVGAAAVFLVDAAGLVWSAFEWRRVRYHGDDVPPLVDGSRAESYLRRTSDGFRLVGSLPKFRVYLFTSFTANVAIGASTLGILLLLVRVNGFPFWAYTLAMAVGSLGAFVAAILSERITRLCGGGNSTQSVALALYGSAFLVYLVVSGFSVSGIALACVADFLTGMAISLYVVNNAAAHVRVVPRDLRGRSSALRGFANGVALAVGPLLAGWMLAFTTPRALMAACAIWLFCCSIAFAVCIRKVTRVDLAPPPALVSGGNSIDWEAETGGD